MFKVESNYNPHYFLLLSTIPPPNFKRQGLGTGCAEKEMAASLILQQSWFKHRGNIW